MGVSPRFRRPIPVLDHGVQSALTQVQLEDCIRPVSVQMNIDHARSSTGTVTGQRTRRLLGLYCTINLSTKFIPYKGCSLRLASFLVWVGRTYWAIRIAHQLGLHQGQESYEHLTKVPCETPVNQVGRRVAVRHECSAISDASAAQSNRRSLVGYMLGWLAQIDPAILQSLAIVGVVKE